MNHSEGKPPTVRGDDQHLAHTRRFRLRVPFGIAGRQPALTRLNPDLREVKRLPGGRIELAVGDTRPGARELYLAGLELFAIAHAVLARKSAFEHVAEDLHVPVRVRPKAHASGHPVVVDDPQAAKAYMSELIRLAEQS